MTTKNEVIVGSLPAGAMNFTTRSGKQMQMEFQEIPYALLTSLYRMQEDYEEKGEFLTIEGVIRRLFDLGCDTQRTRWKWGEINKETKNLKTTFEKDVAETLRLGDEMTAEEKLAHVTNLFNETQTAIASLRNKRK